MGKNAVAIPDAARALMPLSGRRVIAAILAGIAGIARDADNLPDDESQDRHGKQE